jgi:hypothetical protein
VCRPLKSQLQRPAGVNLRVMQDAGEGMKDPTHPVIIPQHASWKLEKEENKRKWKVLLWRGEQKPKRAHKILAKNSISDAFKIILCAIIGCSYLYLEEIMHVHLDPSSSSFRHQVIQELDHVGIWLVRCRPSSQ